MKLRVSVLTVFLSLLFTCSAAHAAPKKVVLNWAAPVAQQGVTITGYKVYRGTATGTEVSFATVVGNVVTFTDITVVPGTSYFYQVTATGTCDSTIWDCSAFLPESAKSNEAASGAIPLNAAPAIGAPTAATAVVQ